MVAGRKRVVERVPTLLIGLLASKGLLPLMPVDVTALEPPPSRFLTNEEGFALNWTVLWRHAPVGEDYAPVDAVAGWRDGLDYHWQTDVRELIHIAGPGSLNLIWALAGEARSAGRRLIGTVNLENERMNAALKRSGCVPRRTMWEAPL